MNGRISATEMAGSLKLMKFISYQVKLIEHITFSQECPSCMYYVLCIKPVAIQLLEGSKSGKIGKLHRMLWITILTSIVGNANFITFQLLW